MKYWFGTGHGAPTTWHSPADVDLNGDGVAEAVALDFDGDGRVDDLMWDTDGDGVADLVVLDLDDDGRGDHYYSDPTGCGNVERACAATVPRRRHAVAALGG